MSQLQELHTQKQLVLFTCILHHVTAIFIAHFHKCVFCKNQRGQGKLFVIYIDLFWPICMPLKTSKCSIFMKCNIRYFSRCLNVDNLIALTQSYTVLPKINRLIAVKKTCTRNVQQQHINLTICDEHRP